MLTGDENIVEADCTVFWKIRDPGQFLFKVDNPELAVRIAAEGAFRDVISRTPIQAATSNKRQQIADETLALLQKLLDDEHSGVEITQVQLQRVEPPPSGCCGSERRRMPRRRRLGRSSARQRRHRELESARRADLRHPHRARGRKESRTAAWLIAKAAKRPGKVGIIVPSRRHG
jgi:regulator of protease activity HflC (stomatin/prohibitin superfamily)